MILSKFLKREFFTQNTKSILDNTLNFLSFKDLIFNET